MNAPALLLGACAALGLTAVAWHTRPAYAARLIDAGLWALAGALLMGRAVFVSLTWTYYQAHVLEIPQVWKGGFSASGALFGGILALITIAFVSRQPLGELVDALEPLAAAVGVSAWLAAWLDHSAYGQPLNFPFVFASADEWGNVIARWPVQLAGALLVLAVYISLDLARRLKGLNKLIWRGAVGGIGLFAQGLVLFGLSFLRGDPAQAWNGWRLDAWGGLAGAMAALAVFLITRWEWGQKRNEAELGSLADEYQAG